MNARCVRRTSVGQSPSELQDEDTTWARPASMGITWLRRKPDASNRVSQDGNWSCRARDRGSCLKIQLEAASSRVSNQISPCSSGLWVCGHVVGCGGEVGCVGEVVCVSEVAGDGLNPESERQGGVLGGGIDRSGDVKCLRRRVCSRQRGNCSARLVVSSILRCGVCSAVVIAARLELPTAWEVLATARRAPMMV